MSPSTVPCCGSRASLISFILPSGSFPTCLLLISSLDKVAFSSSSNSRASSNFAFILASNSSFFAFFFSSNFSNCSSFSSLASSCFSISAISSDILSKSFEYLLYTPNASFDVFFFFGFSSLFCTFTSSVTSLPSLSVNFQFSSNSSLAIISFPALFSSFLFIISAGALPGFSCV